MYKSMRTTSAVLVLVASVMLLYNNCSKSLTKKNVQAKEQSSTSSSPNSSNSTPVVAKIEIVQQPQGGTFNAGDSVLLVVVANSESELNYTWYHDGALIDGAASNILSFNAVAMSDAGDYVVVVSDENGDVESDSAQLTIIATNLISGKTTDECLAVGGEVVEAEPGALICKVSGAACPSGFVKHENWQATAERTCSNPYDGQLNCTPTSFRGCGGSALLCSGGSFPVITAAGQEFSNSSSITRATGTAFGQTCGPACGAEHCRTITFYCDAVVTHVGCK